MFWDVSGCQQVGACPTAFCFFACAVLSGESSGSGDVFSAHDAPHVHMSVLGTGTFPLPP